MEGPARGVEDIPIALIEAKDNTHGVGEARRLYAA